MTDMFPPSRMGMLLMLVFFVHLASSAPVQDTMNIIKRPGRVPRMRGCYYNSAHFDNGERILTNEPCLNCTCIDSMLMCYLRVCPFVKPVGEECIETKDKDDCCPKIWCPEVPKEKDCDDPDHDHTKQDKPGCFLNEKYYPDGAMLPHDPKKPCEVCYCIRNSTSCVVQECELKVDGCTPVYKPGQCCPCRYNCSYEESTTIPPGVTAQDLSDGCILPDGNIIDDGEAVNSTNPCEHCYCMRNELVCAIQECQSPGYNCQPLPPMPGQCCPERYECPSKDVTKAPGLSFSSAFTSEESTTPQTPAKKQHGVKTSSIKGIGIKGAPYIPSQFVPVGIKGISQVAKSTERTTSSITSAINISPEKLNVDEKKIDGHGAFEITSEAEIETTETPDSIQDDTMSTPLEPEELKNLSEKGAFATTPVQDDLFTDEFNFANTPSTESDKTTESPLDTMTLHSHSTPKPEATKSTEESTYSTTLQQDMSVKSSIDKESEENDTKKVISGDNTIKQPTLDTLPEVKAISTLSPEQIKETTDNILRTTLKSDHSPEELNLADTIRDSDTIKNASKNEIGTSLALEPENIDAVTLKPLHSNITTDVILPTTLETGYSPEELNLADNIRESDTIKNASKNEIDKSLTLVPENVDTVTTKPLHSNVTIPKSSITEEYEEISNEEKKPDFIISTKHQGVKGAERKPTLQENTHFKETSLHITPVYPNKEETIITDSKFSSELPSSVPPSESLLLESFGTQTTYQKPKPLVYNQTSEDISKDPENALKLPISILRITGPHKNIVIPGVTGVIGRPLAPHSVKGIDQSEIIAGVAVKTPDIKYEGVKGHPSSVKGQPSYPQRLRPILPVGAIPGESNSPAPSRKRPVVMSIPGEGTCRVGKKVYRSGQPMESTDLCKTNCQCINSVVYCDDVICPKPPSDKRLKCTEIRSPSKCCPRYDCRTASFTTTEVTAIEKEITTSNAPPTPMKIITTVSSTGTPSEAVTIPTETGSYPTASSSPSNISIFPTEKSSETEITSTFIESDDETTVQTTVVETSPQTTSFPVTGSGTFDENSTSSERIFSISEESTPIVTESSESVKSSDFEHSTVYPLKLSTSIELPASTGKEIDILHTSVYTDASSEETQFSGIEKTSEEPDVPTLNISEEMPSTSIPTTISFKPTVSSQKDEVYFSTVTPSSEASTFLETKEHFETKNLSTLSPEVASTTDNTETYSTINTEIYSPVYPKQSETISTETSKFSEAQENSALTETTETSHKIGEELGLSSTSTEIFKETAPNDKEDLHFVTTVLPQKAAETTTERKEFTKSEEIHITINAEPASSTKETSEHSVTSTDIEEITTVAKDMTNLAITTKHPEDYSSAALTEKLGTEERISTTFDKVTETSAISTPEHTSVTSMTSFISVEDAQSEEKRTEFSVSTVFSKVTDIKFEDPTAFSKHEEKHTTLSEGISSNTSTVINDGTSTYDVPSTISTKPTSDIISYEIDHSIDDASTVSSTLIHENDEIRLEDGTLHPTSTESNVHETTKFSESEDVKISNETASISSKTTFDSTEITLLDNDTSHMSTGETTSKPLLVTLSATTGYSKIEETFSEISETKISYEQKPTTSENISKFVTTSIPDISTSTEKLETEFPETTVSKATEAIFTETEKLPIEENTVSDKTTTFSKQDFNSDEVSHFVTLTLSSEEISNESDKTSDGESTSSVTSSYHSQNTLAYTSNDTVHYDFTTTIQAGSSFVTSSPKSPEITTYAETDDIHFEITTSASPADSTHDETTEYPFDKTTSKLSEVTAFSKHEDASSKSTFTETSKFSSVDEKATALSEANIAFETPTTSPKESTETPTQSERTTEFSEVYETSTIVSQKTDLTESKPAITDETAKTSTTLSSLYIETTASSEKKVIPFSVTTSSVKTATKETVQALEFEDKKSYSETTALPNFTALGNEKLPESTLSSIFSEATLSRENDSVSFITETSHSLSKFPETTLTKETSTTLEKIQPTSSPSSTLSEEMSVKFGISSPTPEKTEIIQEEDKIKLSSLDSETPPFLTTLDHHEAEKSSLLSKTTESTEQNFFTFDNEVRTTLPPGKGDIDSSTVSPNPTSEIIVELSTPENLSTVSKIDSTFIGTEPESHEIPSVISETTFYEENESNFSVTTPDITAKIQEKSGFSDKGTTITSQEISTLSQTTPIIYEQKTSFEFTNTPSQETITDYFVSTTLSSESSKSTNHPAEEINLNAEETYGHLLDKESSVLASSSSNVLEASEETKSTAYANKTFQLSNTTQVLPTILVISEIPEAISDNVERITDVPTEKFSTSEKITTSGTHSTDINITLTEFPSTDISDSTSVELTETFHETTFPEETTFYEAKSTSSEAEVNIFEKTTTDPLITTSNSTDENLNYNYTSTDETSKYTYNTEHDSNTIEAGDKKKEYESELSSTIATEIKTTSELISMGETTASDTKIESELNILSDHTIKMDKQGTASTESSSLYQSTKHISNESENTEQILEAYSDDTQAHSEETTTPYSEEIDKVYEERLTTTYSSIPEKTVEISFSNTLATNDTTSVATKAFTAPSSTSNEESEIIELQTESLTDLEIRPNNKSTASDMEFNISMNIRHVTTQHQDKNVSTPSESFTYDHKTQTVLHETSDTLENKLPISTSKVETNYEDSETLEATSEASMSIETKSPIIVSSSEDTHTLSPSTEAFHTEKLAQSITDAAPEPPLIEINLHQDLLSTKTTNDGDNKADNVTLIENNLQDLSIFATENGDKRDLAELSRISTTEISKPFSSENVQTTSIHPHITLSTVMASGITEVLNTTFSSETSHIAEDFLENTSISTNTTENFQEYSTEKPSLGGTTNVNLINEDVHKLNVSTIDWNYDEINVNKTSSISTEDIAKPSIHESLVTTTIFTGIDNIALELVKPENLQITYKPFDIPDRSSVKTTESATTLEKEMDPTSKVEIDKTTASFDNTEPSPFTVKTETAVSFDETAIPHSLDKTETPASYDKTETPASYDKTETSPSTVKTETAVSFDETEIPHSFDKTETPASYDKTETSPSTVKTETAVSFDEREIPHSFDKTETPASYDKTEISPFTVKTETDVSLEETEKPASFDNIEMPEHPILVSAEQLGLDTSDLFKNTSKINQTLNIHKIDHVESEITASNTGLTKKTHTVGTVLAENLELSISPIYWTKTLGSTSDSVTEASLETSSQTFAPSTITISEVFDFGDSITSGDIKKETAFPPSMPSSDNLMSHAQSFPKTSTKLSGKPSSETGTTALHIVNNEENATYSHEHQQSTTLKSTTYDLHFSIKEAEEDGLPSSTFDAIKGNSEIPPIYEDTLSSETNTIDNETIESLDAAHISDLSSMITGSLETNIPDKTVTEFSINAEKTVSKFDYPDLKKTSIENEISTKDGISELVTENIMDIRTELTTTTSEVSKPTIILSYSTTPSTTISEYSTSDINIESSKTEAYPNETEQVHEFNVETSPVATANTSQVFSETSSAPESSEISTTSGSSQYETSEIIIQETQSSTENDSVTFNAEFSTESHKQNPTSESSTSDVLYFKSTTSVSDVTDITSQEGTIHFNEKVIDSNKIDKDSLSAISSIDVHSDLTTESGVPLTSEFSTEIETIKTDLHPPVLDSNDPKYLVSINISQMENNTVNEVSESITEKLPFETSSDESSYISQFTSQSSAKQDQQIVTERILVTDVTISEATTESETVPDYSQSLTSLPTSSTTNVLSSSGKTTKYDEITPLSQEHQTIRTSIPLSIPTEISSISPETTPSNITTLGFEEITVKDSKTSFPWDNQVSTENYVTTSIKTEWDETTTASALYSPQYETHKHEQVAKQYGETPISSSFFEQYTIVDDTFKDFYTAAEQAEHVSYDMNFTKEPTVSSSDEIFTKVITQKPLYVSFASESTETTQQSEIEPASTTFNKPVSRTYVPVTLSDDLIIFTEKPQFPVKPFVALNKKHEIDNSILTSTTKDPMHENLTTSENVISEEVDAQAISEPITSTVTSSKPSTLFDTVTIHSLAHSSEIITELGIAIHPTQLKTITPNVSDAIELTSLPDTTIYGTTEPSDVNGNKIDLTTEMETTKQSIIDGSDKSDEAMSTIETLGNESTTMNTVSSQDNVEKITSVNIPHGENFNTDKSEVTEGVSSSTLTIPDRDSYSDLNLHTIETEIQNIKTTLKTFSPLGTIPYFDLEENSTYKTFISRESTTHPTIAQTELTVNLVALENAPSIKYGHTTKLPDFTDATTLDVSMTEQTHSSKHDAIEKTTYSEESSIYTSKFQPTFKPAEQISTVHEINETQNITESNELITTVKIPIPKPAEIVLTQKPTEKASELEFTTTEQYIQNKIQSEKSSEAVTTTYITVAKETDISSLTTESTTFVVEMKVTNGTSETSQTLSFLDSVDTKSITEKEMETSTDLSFNAETITVTEESLVTEEAPKIQESETSFVITSSVASLDTYGASEASQTHDILHGIDTKSITEKQMDETSMGLNSETGILTVTNESTVTEEATSKIQESGISFVTTSSIDSLKQSTLKETEEIATHETTSQPPASVTYGITKISSPEEIKISTVAPSYPNTAEHPNIEIETLSDEMEDPNSPTETAYTQTLFTDISENITLFKDKHSTKSKTEVFSTTESFSTSDISSTVVKGDEDINESSTYIIANKTNISGDSEKSGIVTDIEVQSTEGNIYESTKVSVHIEDSSNYSDSEAGTSISTLGSSDMTFKYVTTTASYFTSTNQEQITDDIQKTTAKSEISEVTTDDIKSDNEKETKTTESSNTQSGYGSNDIFDVPAEIHETSHQTELNETPQKIENISADLEKSKDYFNISRPTIIPDVEPVNLSTEEHVTVSDPKDLSQPPYNKSITDFYPLANEDDIVEVETSTFEEIITSLSMLDHESADYIETTTDKKDAESIFSSDNMLTKDADKLITSLDEDSKKITKDSTVTFQELKSTTDGSIQYDQQTSSPHKIELSTSDIYKTVSTTTVDADQNSIHSNTNESSKTTNDNDIEVELQSTTNISPAAIIYNFTIKIESDLMNLKDSSTTRAVPSESLQTTTPTTIPSPKLDLMSVESSKSDLSTFEYPTSDFSTTKIPASDLTVAESTSDLITTGRLTSDVSTTESSTLDLSTAKSPSSNLSTAEDLSDLSTDKSPPSDLSTAESPTSDLSTAKSPSSDLSTAEDLSDLSTAKSLPSDLSTDESPTSDLSTAGKSTSEVSTTENPISDLNTTGKQTSEVSTTESPASDLSTSKSPTDFSITEWPTSDASATQSPTSDLSTNESPASDLSTTQNPSDLSTAKSPTWDLSTPESQNTDLSTAKTAFDLSTTESLTSNLSTTESPTSEKDQFPGSIQNATGSVDFEISRHPIKDTLLGLPENISNINQLIYPNSNKTDLKVPHLQENLNLSNRQPIPIAKPGATKSKYPGPSTPAPWVSYTVHEDIMKMISTKFPSSLPTVVYEIHSSTKPGLPHFGEGSEVCYFDGEVYFTSEQIPQKDNCEFCFCFKGDVICLQQTCPPPIAGCYAIPIDGFCCPRFHCPVQQLEFNSFFSTTTTTPPNSKSIQKVYPAPGCEIEGHKYRLHQVVRSASNACRVCRCDYGGIMKCDPRVCKPKESMIQQIVEEYSKKK